MVWCEAPGRRCRVMVTSVGRVHVSQCRFRCTTLRWIPPANGLPLLQKVGVRALFRGPSTVSSAATGPIPFGWWSPRRQGRQRGPDATVSDADPASSCTETFLHRTSERELALWQLWKVLKLGTV